MERFGRLSLQFMWLFRLLGFQSVFNLEIAHLYTLHLVLSLKSLIFLLSLVFAGLGPSLTMNGTHLEAFSSSELKWENNTLKLFARPL